MPARCKTTKTFARDLSDEIDLFRVLADEHRLRILATLARADDDCCVCDLNAGLPLLQPTVSHHLKSLKEAGLVECERRGTWVYYRLADGIRERLERALDTIVPERIHA